jgi:hypothetical protein
MGATVTCKKLAAAFACAEGVFYALFEQTYEKNCYPHTPGWSCVHFGNIDDALRTIFRHASSCEGGMLQNRSGCITPEGYIAGWMKEMASPMRMPDCRIALQVSDSIYASVSSGNVEAVCGLLGSNGRDAAADAVRAGGQATLSLHHDAIAIARLCAAIAPWRLIQSYAAPLYEARDASLGNNPRPAAAFEIARPAAFKIDDHNRLLQREDGSWFCAGWQYAIVGDFVAGLWNAEREAPGSFKKRIQAFRDALNSAEPVPAGTKVVVSTRAPALDDYRRRTCDQFVKRFPVTPTPEGFEAFPSADNLYDLCSLRENATWVLPPMEREPTQPSLFARNIGMATNPAMIEIK